MKKIHSKILIAICLVSTATMSPKKGCSFSSRTTGKTTKAYKPKATFSGFGRVSKSTGRIKTKMTSGHFKKSIGYKFVNPYSRS